MSQGPNNGVLVPTLASEGFLDDISDDDEAPSAVHKQEETIITVDHNLLPVVPLAMGGKEGSDVVSVKKRRLLVPLNDLFLLGPKGVEKVRCFS
jgi:hypothetical protein